MNVETFLETVFAFIKNSENLFFVLYSVLACLLTQVVKKIFVNRVKVEIFHKFNLAIFLPFVFAIIFASVDRWLFAKIQFSLDSVYTVLLHGASIGAMASVMYRFVHTLSGNSLSQLLKDDVFGIFYNQLVYFGSVKSQLESGELKLADFLTQVKVVANNAKVIYQADGEEADKRQKLTELLAGIISTESLSSAVSVIHKALYSTIKPTTANTDSTTK